jgi:hypothetical protein
MAYEECERLSAAVHVGGYRSDGVAQDGYRPTAAALSHDHTVTGAKILELAKRS